MEKVDRTKTMLKCTQLQKAQKRKLKYFQRLLKLFPGVTVSLIEECKCLMVDRHSMFFKCFKMTKTKTKIVCWSRYCLLLLLVPTWHCFPLKHKSKNEASMLLFGKKSGLLGAQIHRNLEQPISQCINARGMELVVCAVDTLWEKTQEFRNCF